MSAARMARHAAAVPFDGGATTSLLEVEDLVVDLPVEGAMRRVLHEVSLSIGPGEAVGLVGESGSGKSMTARAIDRLLPPGAAVGGSIRFDGKSVMALTGPALRRFRGEVAMIFQDPRAHINPVRRIGDFMTEALRSVQNVPDAEAERRAVGLL
jgi:ABC-type glutathione transport system ATPase component